MSFFVNNFLLIAETVSGTAALLACLIFIVAVKQKRRTQSNQ